MMKQRVQLAVALFVLAFLCTKNTQAQEFQYNYDESKVPEYTLPPLFDKTFNNNKAKLAYWENHRKKELLNLFEENLYGRRPDFNYTVNFEVLEDYQEAFNGTALRKQIKMNVVVNGKTYSTHILLYIPKSAQPVPVFVSYNFYGNHTISQDPGVIVAKHYSDWKDDWHILGFETQENSRGVRANRWPIAEIIKRGYGLMVMCYQEVQPDRPVSKEFPGFLTFLEANAPNSTKDMNWGHIAIWSWFQQRALDYIAKDAKLDANNIMVLGHSRLAKTALWTGVQDPRVMITFSNNAGCLGDALSNRKYGEHVARITHNFPYWFVNKTARYAHKEEQLPVDQHQLLALIAPRHVYLGAAKEDKWADPLGQFLALKESGEVFSLYNSNEVFIDTMPKLMKPFHGYRRAFHYRKGNHDLTFYDWIEYLNYADLLVKNIGR